MISYGTNLLPTGALPELKEKTTKKQEKSWFYYLIDFIGDLIVEATTIAVNLISGGTAGRLVNIGLGAIKDILLPALFGYSVDIANVIQNAFWTSTYYVGGRIINFAKKTFKGYAKTINILKKGIYYVSNPFAFMNFAINKVSRKLTQGLLKKYGKEISKKVLKYLRIGMKLGTKSIIFFKGLANSNNKLNFAAKNLTTFIRAKFRWWTKKWVSNYALNNFSKKLIKSNFKNLDEVETYMRNHNISWIPFKDSQWIDGVKIASREWIDADETKKVSFYVFFKPSTTNGKQSLIFFDRPVEELFDFVNAASKGKYYLDNYAWGWEVGKKIRKTELQKERFWINHLEAKSKYTEHFLASIKEFDKTSNEAVEEFRNQFKILSSTRDRKLGNRVVVEYQSGQVKFYKRIGTEEAFNLKFQNKFKDIRRTSMSVKLVKKTKKL